MDNKFTLYCRGFPQELTDQELRSVFSKYGNILKFFKHNSGTYAMIQYDNLSSCTNAIHNEHGVAPLKLYVNLARNQPTDRKESTESSPPKANAKYPPRNNQSDNVSSYMPKTPSFDQIEPIEKMSSPPQQPNNNYNFASAQTVTLSKPKMFSNAVYKEDIIYMDRHNNILPVLKDFKDELYVPLSCIEGLKRYVKKTPISNGTNNIDFNPDDYTLLDDATGFSRQDDDTHSNHSGGRIVQFGENLSDIKIKVDVSGTSQMNTTEPVFDSLVQASRSNASRHSYPNKQQHHQQQQTQFGGHTNENRQFNEIRRPDAPENRPYDKFGGNENRPYDNRRPDDGKRNQNQPFNRNKQFNQDQPRDFNKPFNNEQQPRDFSKQFNQDQPRDFNRPSRNPIFNRQNANDSNSRRSLPPNRKFENKLLEHKPMENDDSWDSAAHASVDAHSTETRASVADQISDSARRHSINDRLKIQKLGEILYQTTELPKRVFTEEKDVTVVHVENGMYTLPDVAKANNFEYPPKPVQAAPVNLLKELQAMFLSNIQEGSNGIMEITTHISKETCIAFLIPVDLTDAYADAMEIIPDPTAENISPKVGDIVIAFTEGAWARAYVLNVQQNAYKVAFIDYGNIDTVETVKPLAAKWSKLPQFACVCQLPGNNIELRGDMTFITTSVSSDSFTVTLNLISDTIHNVVITPWNPNNNYNKTPSATSTPIALSKLRSTELTSPPAVQSPPRPVSKVVKKSTKLSELELHDGDAIRLVYTSENNLYVRTKQAHVILKRIDEYMKQYATQSQPSANNLVVGQYVAAEFDGGWYRAVISDIKTSIGTVLFIDYGNDEEKPISSFKILNDEVRNEPCTLIKVKLRGFTNTNFSPESLKYLQSLSDSNTLFNAKFTSLENGIDMITTKDGVNISDYLFKMGNKAHVANMATPANVPIPNPAPVISKQSTFANLTVPGKNDPKIFEVPIQKMPLGKHQVQFLCRGDWHARSVLVCYNNPQSIHKIHVELGKCITHYGNNIAPPEPYYPEIEEHVIVKENDKWFRAIDISEPLPNNEFNCFFVDFGMSHAIHASNIRQMPAELAKEPAIANFAYVNSIPAPPDDILIKRLEELLLVQNIYEVDILELDELGFYDVVFPSVLKVLRQEKLI